MRRIAGRTGRKASRGKLGTGMNTRRCPGPGYRLNFRFDQITHCGYPHSLAGRPLAGRMRAVWHGRPHRWTTASASCFPADPASQVRGVTRPLGSGKLRRSRQGSDRVAPLAGTLMPVRLQLPDRVNRMKILPLPLPLAAACRIPGSRGGQASSAAAARQCFLHQVNGYRDRP